MGVIRPWKQSYSLSNSLAFSPSLCTKILVTLHDYILLYIIPIIANYISLAASLFKRSPGNILSALPSAPLIRRHLPHHSWHLSKWAVKIDRDFDDTNCKYMCLLAASLNPFKILLADLWGNVLPSGPLNVHLAACWEKMSFPPGSVFCPLICRKKKGPHSTITSIQAPIEYCCPSFPMQRHTYFAALGLCEPSGTWTPLPLPTLTPHARHIYHPPLSQ